MSQRIVLQAELMQRLIDRDQDALTEIMQICRGALLQYTSRLTGDYEAAEEIVSDAFLKLWRHADTLRSDISPKTWLFTICHNATVDHGRCWRSKRHESLDTVSADDGMSIRVYRGWAELPEDVVDRLMMEQLLGDVLPVIPTAYRTCLELRVGGYDYAEISAGLDIPLGTVKSRINYGRNRARTIAAEAGWDLGTLTCETA